MKGLMGKEDQDHLTTLQAQEGVTLPGMPSRGSIGTGIHGIPALGGFSHGGSKKNRKKR